ncbi:MAG: AtuA-related protein [Bacteroidota bacterium]
MKIRLFHIAHARSGEKGDMDSVGIVARQPEYYSLLVKYCTEAKVKEHLSGIYSGSVERSELPELGMVNFRLLNASVGASAMMLEEIQHKTLSSVMLRMELEIKETI